MSIRDVLVSDMISGTKAPIRATTLEAHHVQKMKEFTETKHNLANLQSSLEELELKISEIPDSGIFSDEWRQLSDQAESTRLQIRSIQADDQRLDYFLNVGDMLFQYFDAHETLAKGETGVNSKMRMPTNSVLSYFTDATDESPTPKEQKTPKKASEIDSSEGMNRDKMMERYLAVVEPSAIKSGIMPGSGIEPGWGTCPTCDVEMTFYQNEALLGCPRCGHEEFILIDSEKPSYKDPPREITYFAYKKINHFNEWLAQFQAKENTDIPQDIIEAVMRELRKERISDPKKVKKDKKIQVQ
jgi:predicted  nucleic acid-binding Zn-ribbon protein